MVKKKKKKATTEGKTTDYTPRKRTPKAKSSTEGKEKTTPKPKAAQGGALANKKRKRAATEVAEKQDEVEDKEHNGGTKGALDEALPHEDAPKAHDEIKPKAEVEKSTTSEVSNTEIEREDLASDELLEAPPKAEPDKKKQKTKRKPKVWVIVLFVYPTRPLFFNCVVCGVLCG